jgi:ABC-type transport system involved in cytochrome c biogenesis permease subunit
MRLLQRATPWVVLLIAIAFVLGGLLPAKKDAAYDWDAFGRIPVSAQGRTKPLDTFARNTMMQISGRQTYTTDDGSRPAIEWLADVLDHNPRAADRQIFRIDHPDVLSLLGLSADRKRFSFNELRPKFDELARQTKLASAVPSKQQDPFQRQIMDLNQRLTILVDISQYESPYGLAPLAAGEEWRPLSLAMTDPAKAQGPALEAYQQIMTAYHNADATGFNAAVASYLSLLGDKLPAETHRAGYEVGFNRFEPFYRASGLYVLAFLLAGVGFIVRVMSRGEWPRVLARATVMVLFTALTVHTVGIVSRIYLQGRPPVTNLYSSAVFIGWVGVLIGLTLEWLYGLGLGSIVASVIGFATLVVAHNLSTTGDTMEMMQAVLDTNFWLATHVVVVTIGYSATFLAGFLGVAYIGLGVFTRTLKTDPGKTLPKTVYGVICFASLASFVGTVLGGIWADQSWGRFWGWDPKENGAALIVLMNLLTLHARWGGMVRERGVAVLAVLGNIVTAWSWFGTNMLGVGLHSYGFMASAVFYLAAFMLSQLGIAFVGLIPLRMWRSFRPAPARAGAPSPEPLPA